MSRWPPCGKCGHPEAEHLLRTASGNSCTTCGCVSYDEAPRTLVTQYGFEWGNARVERLVSHRGHRVLHVQTARQRVEVRVTPAGLVRVRGPWQTPKGRER